MIAVEIPQAPVIAAKLAAAPEVVRAATSVAVQRSIIYLQAEMRREEPVKTGTMRNRTMSEMLPEAGGEVRGRVFVDIVSPMYPVYVNDGTGQYALDQSKTSGRITNGGIKPRQFAEKSLETVKPLVVASFTQAADVIASEVM